MQSILDRTYAAAGPHLLSVVTPERRMTAEELAAELGPGVQVLVLATSTADDRPLTAPVDGLFYRGEFWFGSVHDSVRFRHLRLRPDVSATHTRGEPFAVTVHGRAFEVDLAEHDGFAGYCKEIYGPEWSDWAEKAPYARIEASRMFSFTLREGSPADEPPP